MGASTRSAVLALGLVALTPGQEPLALTPSGVAGIGLPIRTDTVDGFVQRDRGPRQLFGRYIYGVSRITVADAPAYLVTMNYRGTGPEFQADSLALDAATLTPLWRRFYARVDTAEVTFHGRRANGWSQREGQPRRTIDFEISPDAFVGGLFRWVLGTLELAPEQTYTLRSFDIWSSSESTSGFQVRGEDRVQAGSRSIDAWVVQTGAGMRYWVEKANGRVLQVLQPGNGSQQFWFVLRSHD